MIAQQALAPEIDDNDALAKRPGPRKNFIHPNKTPPGAAIWRDKRGKAETLRRWRRVVGMRFAKNPSAIRIAWAIEWLISNDGFAFATTAFLAQETGLAANKAQDALTELERGGAIIRCHAYNAGRPQRRIYISREYTLEDHPNVGVIVSPLGSAEYHPLGRVTEKEERKNRSAKPDHAISATMRAARAEAERKAKRERDGAIYG